MPVQIAGHGPNVGHGWVKYFIITAEGQELEPVVFPATIARASQAAAGALTKTATITIGKAKYWTGWDAQLSATQITMLGQDRLADPVYIPALLGAALDRFGHLNGSARGVCVSGLPASWTEQTKLIDGQQVKNAHEVQLGAALRSGAPADMYAKVVIIAEPVGLGYSVLLDNRGQMAGDAALATGRLGVVDMGHRTDDAAELLRMQVVKSSLWSDDTGTIGPLTEIRARLSAYFDRRLSILETDMAIRAGHIVVAGQRRELPKGWDRPLIDNGQLKAANLASIWQSGGHLDAIVIGGGGAEDERLTAPTLARFPHAVVADRPQLAIPIGYARLACRLAANLR